MQYMREGTFALFRGGLDNCRMGRSRYSFRELLTQAAGLVPGLVNDDGKVNLTAVARYSEKRGHAVSQPTLFRHFNAPADKGPKMDSGTVEALHLVFGIPRSMLRHEEMDADTQETLARYPLSTILLAEKIEALPPPLRRSVLLHIEELLRREDEHRQSMGPGTNISRFPKRPL